MRFDLTVIGGGHSGLVCAALAAESGLSVGVIGRNAARAIVEDWSKGPCD